MSLRCLSTLKLRESKSLNYAVRGIEDNTDDEVRAKIDSIKKFAKLYTAIDRLVNEANGTKDGLLDILLRKDGWSVERFKSCLKRLFVLLEDISTHSTATTFYHIKNAIKECCSCKLEEMTEKHFKDLRERKREYEQFAQDLIHSKLTFILHLTLVSIKAPMLVPFHVIYYLFLVLKIRAW